MDSLQLRKAMDDDSEFAYAVKCAAFRALVESVLGWDEEEQRELHAWRFATQDFRIVTCGGADVGMVALAVDAECMHLHQIYILPEHQGQGIGGWCMQQIMGEARELGLPVRLQVLKVNARARAFYERLGFVPVGESKTHDFMEWWP